MKKPKRKWKHLARGLKELVSGRMTRRKSVLDEGNSVEIPAELGFRVIGEPILAGYCEKGVRRCGTPFIHQDSGFSTASDSMAEKCSERSSNRPRKERFLSDKSGIWSNLVVVDSERRGEPKEISEYEPVLHSEGTPGQSSVKIHPG